MRRRQKTPVEAVPVPPPSSGAGDAPGSRWGAFTEEEIRTINIALIDSGSIRGDFDWYLRCSNLHIELVAVIASWERALAKARGEKPDAR